MAMWVKNQHRMQDAANAASLGGGEGGLAPDLEQALYNLKTAFTAALDDNLDLAHFWPRLFAFAKMVNAKAGRLNAAEAEAVHEQLLACDRVLGFLDRTRLPLAPKDWPAEALDVVRRREAARQARDFVLADRLRDDLAVLGLRLEDHPLGARLFRL